MDTGNMHKKFGKDHVCGSGDILSDRQTHRQMHSSQYSATALAGEVKNPITQTVQFTGSTGCAVNG